jgi:hypothetical protein
LEAVSPTRLQQLHSLLDEYAALVRADALRKDEIFGIDAAIFEAEETLGGLGTPATPDKPPGVIVARDGEVVPAPKELAGGAGTGGTSLDSSPKDV